ncbi:MAG: hypothetical protein C4316_12680 [Chloroflexota bacterium]
MAHLAESLMLEVSPDELQRHLEVLAGLDRLSGGEGERRAVEYLAETLKSYGVRTELLEFESYISYPLEAELWVLEPELRQIPCRARSFSASTPPGGLEGELVFVASAPRDERTGHLLGRGDIAAAYRRPEIRGRVVLTTGGGPDALKNAQDAGALAQIHMWPSDEDVIHEMIVTPVWGTPTPESAEDLPKIPALSVKRRDGEYLRGLLERGTVRVKLKTRTWTGWKTLPLLVGQVDGCQEPERFLLVGAHIDSWYEGVTDNATGDVCLLEMARILARYRDGLRRSVRFAWWPGHSVGRYSGSTWYADHYWEDLRYNCLGYLNIDSPGIRGAAVWDCRYNMAEVEQLVARAVREVTGQEPNIRRPFKAGDQSFWGIGLPSIGAFRMLPPDHPDRAIVGGSGGGWWWHTPEDTLDKADIGVLADDTRLYLRLVADLVVLPVLPFEFVTVADDFILVLSGLQERTGRHLDLSAVLERAGAFRQLAARLEALRQELARSEGDGRVSRLNAGLMSLSRVVNPVLYTAAGDFDQDPALQLPMLPGLRRALELPELDPSGDEYRFLITRLVRERNRVNDCLRRAIGEVERLLAELG